MRAQYHNCILGVKWLSGCSEEGDHEVYSICYILRKITNKKKSQTKQILQKILFSLRSSNTHHNIPFNFQFFYELKANGSSILETFAWRFHFSLHLGFTKFIFSLREYQKTANLLKKEKVCFNWDSLYAKLNSHYRAWS